jgi:hypothetical protein
MLHVDRFLDNQRYVPLKNRTGFSHPTGKTDGSTVRKIKLPLENLTQIKLNSCFRISDNTFRKVDLTTVWKQY